MVALPGEAPSLGPRILAEACPVRACPGRTSGVDTLHLRIVERPRGNHRRIESAGDVDFPVAAAEVRLIDNHLGFDHRESHGATEGVTVGSGTHVTDRHTLAVYQLGVKHEGLRVLHEY